MSVQKRWVLLEVSIEVPEKEIAEVLEEDITEYITNELSWSRESFSGMDIVWIADNYEPNVQMEDE